MTFSLAQVDYNAVPLPLVERIEIITGDASATYGSDAIAGVVNTILRMDQIDAADYRVESTTPLGTIVQIREFDRGGETFIPRTNRPIVNGFTTDMDGDGFVDFDPAPAGFTVTGVQHQLLFDKPVLPQGLTLLGSGSSFVDFKGPTIDDGFDFRGRQWTVGQPLDLFNGATLPLSNFIAPDTDLRQFVNMDGITDGGTGMNSTTPFELYIGETNDEEALFGSDFKWSPGASLSVSASYSYRLGGKFFDEIGNETRDFLRTTSQNPFGWNGVTMGPGVPAGLRVLDDSDATFENLGVRDRSWSRLTNFNFQYCFNTNGAIGLGNYMTGSIKRNGACVEGSGEECNRVPLLFQRSGTLAILQFNNMRSMAGNIPWEGYWEANFRGYSLNGNPFTMMDRRVRLVADATVPSVPVAQNPITSVIEPNTPLQVTMTANDNLHISQVALLGTYNYNSGVFENNEVEFAFPSGFWNIHNERWPMWTGTFDVFPPTRFTLADGLGNVSSNPFDYNALKSISLVSYDAVENRSPRLTFPVDPGHIPNDFQPFVGMKIGVNIGGTINLCQKHAQGTVACPQGVEEEVTITGTATSPTANFAANAIDEMNIFMISVLTRQLVLACATREFTTTQINGSTQALFNCKIDMDRLKIDPGAYLMSILFLSRPLGLGAKFGSFPSANVIRGTF